MKKKMVCTAAALLLFAAAFAGTYAFLSDHEETENQFVVGRLDTSVEEEYEEAQVDLSTQEEKIIPKTAAVRNEGEVPCYVRVCVAFGNGDVGAVLGEVDRKNWVYEDGYYYYRDVLGPGEVTSSLFTSVIIPAGSPVRDPYLAETKELEVIVSEESVSARYADRVFENYREAWAFYLGNRGEEI